MSRKTWTPDDSALLRKLYPNNSAQTCADALGRSIASIYAQANALGLRKSADFYLSPACGRNVQIVGASTRFQPGSKPWNHGKKGWKAGGRSAETRFKTGCMLGQSQHNYKPIGALRISKDGYLERKVTDDPTIVGARRWKAVHRLVWIENNGPIPDGFTVAFKTRRPAIDLKHITIDKLELVSRAQIMLENNRHTMPAEVQELITLRSALTRRIHTKERKSREKQNAGRA